uniref:Uncharacterized protein n=1 Tax=Globodera rostochiensis TaxID=31243 RepID=A0A914I9X5_GLORO
MSGWNVPVVISTPPPHRHKNFGTNAEICCKSGFSQKIPVPANSDDLWGERRRRAAITNKGNFHLCIEISYVDQSGIEFLQRIR